MTPPIDYAALRVQLELKLRAARVALKSQEISAETAAGIDLLERAVDMGTQALITEAAELVGLLEKPEVPAEAPSEQPADTTGGAQGSQSGGPGAGGSGNAGA